MKSSELKKGGLYYAEIGYGQYQVEILEAALYTDREVKRTRETKRFVDPPTPFDPNTGEMNPRVEQAFTERFYETIREPGFRPRASSWGSGGAVAGVPGLARSIVRVLNPGKYPDEAAPKEQLIRPQDIKCTWDVFVTRLKNDREREEHRITAKAAFQERVASVKKLIPSARPANVSGSYRDSLTHVTVDLKELETLLAELGEEDAELYEGSPTQDHSGTMAL